MSGNEAVLFANEFFYRAFAGRDFAAICDAWAEEPGITCIHPGWNPVTGRTAVLESFRAILQGPNPPDVRCVNARAIVRGSTAYVLCHEELGGQYLVSTNIFTQVGNQWRMVHHQAGPAAAPPETIEDPPQPVN